MSWQADGNRNAKGQFIKGNTAAMDRADAFDAKLPKILFLDIETTPIAVWVWSIGKQYVYPQNIIKDNNNKAIDWYVLSWSAKWLYDDKILSDVLTPKEAKERNDKRIIKSVWKLLNEADIASQIIIQENGFGRIHWLPLIINELSLRNPVVVV